MAKRSHDKRNTLSETGEKIFSASSNPQRERNRIHAVKGNKEGITTLPQRIKPSAAPVLQEAGSTIIATVRNNIKQIGRHLENGCFFMENPPCISYE